MEILNSKTRNYLNSLCGISSSAIISYPKTCIKDGKSIQAYLDLEALGEKEFQEFGAFFLKDMLNAISLIDNAVVKQDEQALIISNGKQKVRYNTSSISLLKEQYSGDFGIIDRIKGNDCVADFKMDKNLFKTLKNASSILKDLPILKINKNSEGKINLTIKSEERNGNTFSTEVEGNASDDFSVELYLDFLRQIPHADYDVNVYKNSKGSQVLLLSLSAEYEGNPCLDIVVGTKP